MGWRECGIQSAVYMCVSYLSKSLWRIHSSVSSFQFPVSCGLERVWPQSAMCMCYLRLYLWAHILASASSCHYLAVGWRECGFQSATRMCYLRLNLWAHIPTPASSCHCLAVGWRECGLKMQCVCVGLARTIYIRCTYGFFGLDITKYTVYINVYIRFWQTLNTC